MAQTTWLPRTSFDRHTWLLANGEVVQEPPLEETASGRKVRIPGTNISAYSKDVDDLLGQAVQAIATQKQTNVWMSLHNHKSSEQAALGFDPDAAKPVVHFLQPSDGSRYGQRSTHLWWRFKHPTLPIEAVLTVEASDHGYGSDRPQTIQGRLVLPKQLTDGVVAMSAAHVTEITSRWNASTNSINNYNTVNGIREFVRDNPPAWDGEASKILDSTRFDSERLAVTALLSRVREADSLAEIQIPDLRDPEIRTG